MASVSFAPVGGGLYAAAPDSGQPVLAYWLLINGSPPKGPLDAAATWDYAGCYAFVPAATPVQDPTTFAGALAAQVGSTQPLGRWAAWIADPAKVAGSSTLLAAALPSSSSASAQVAQTVPFPLANVAFSVPQLTGLMLVADAPLAGGGPALVLTTPGAGAQMGLVRAGGGTNLVPQAGQAAVPLGGAATGAFAFGADWDRGTFYAFFMDDSSGWDTPPGSEIRFFFGPAGQEQTLRYPAFLGQAPQQGDPTQALPLVAQLDPLAPWDPARTRFALDLSGYGGGGPVLPTCTSFATTDGRPLTLTPLAGAGFAFGVRPRGPSSESAPSYAYLTPTGTFSAAPGPQPAIRHVMCGLAGTEYLLLEPAATVEFVPGNDAYAPSFMSAGVGAATADPCNPGPGGTPVAPGDLLDGVFTTSWLRVVPGAAPSATIDRGYAVQPQSSVFYGTAGSAGYTYPLALGCRISELADPQETGAVVPLPLLPYGDVWSTGAGTLPDPGLVRAFESQVAAATRFATAPLDSTLGPTFFDVVAHQGLDGGRGRTAAGLLVELNARSSNVPGTINAVRLAKSPNVTPLPGTAEVAFVPPSQTPPVVVPALSNALMNESLFMVATDPAALGGLGAGFLNELQMGEWTFRADVGFTNDQTASPTTILVFKLTTALNLIDLVADAGYWQGWQAFIGNDPNRVKTVQSQLNTLLCKAKPDGPDSMFTDFWALANDPQWTGIVALNCGLDAADLPLDLQDLLGGISGQLRAHHFGVTLNQVKGADGTTWEIDRSSLFAVIHYAKDYTVPPAQNGFGFQVLRLNVQFENSALVHFDSRIAMTIPKLFSTEVVLPASTDPHVPANLNVIEIEGVYQKHGDTGTVVFDTKEPQVFGFKTATSGFRVLNEAYVTDAALAPTSSSTDSGTITVQSRFGLAGMLVFAPDVSSDAQKGKTGSGLDLFSYGDTSTTPANGLAFSSYAIAMTTQIQNNVGTLTSIGPDLSQFAISPATSQYRSQSLVAGIPLRLTTFAQSPSSDGWAVSFDGGSSAGFAPTYALQFQLSLGSLGALSTFADSLDVQLVLGWQAATGSGNDSIWLLMVPPATMLGQLGFGIQGVLATTFTGVNLAMSKYTPPSGTAEKVYGISLLNVEIELLGIPLIPGVSNFVLFADPAQGNASNLGWLMTLKSPIIPPAA